MYHFCTYFDSNYLAKGLTLYRSLVRHAAPFRLWVLCFDDAAYRSLKVMALDGLIPISLRDFEGGDRELAKAKSNRSRIEYFFTCSPSLPLYILRHNPEVNLITYLDADLYFYSDPSPVYRELGDGSVLIIGHRFPERLRHLERMGVYNVGLLAIRRDEAGLACLQWWRERCLEWCYDRVEEGRFADQKYLDDWPTRFPCVVVLEHKGAGLAPWNVEGYALQRADGQVQVDGQPLMFYHFHGLKQTGRWLYDPNLEFYEARACSVLKRDIYGPYIRELHETTRWIALSADPSSTRRVTVRFRQPWVSVDAGALLWLKVAVQRRLSALKRLFQDQLWVAVGGRLVT
jgi:hypothetical protein